MFLDQSCPTLCDPMDCSPPGSSVHGILQARILEWVAIPFSRVSPRPRDWTRVSCTFRWVDYAQSPRESQKRLRCFINKKPSNRASACDLTHSVGLQPSSAGGRSPSVRVTTPSAGDCGLRSGARRALPVAPPVPKDFVEFIQWHCF